MEDEKKEAKALGEMRIIKAGQLSLYFTPCVSTCSSSNITDPHTEGEAVI